MHFGRDLHGSNEPSHLVMAKEASSLSNGIHLLTGKFNDSWMHSANRLTVKEKSLTKYTDR